MLENFIYIKELIFRNGITYEICSLAKLASEQICWMLADADVCS